MKYTDILALLGEGSAHPGGFEGTLKLLRKFNLPPSCRILEVGCGTGRTACYLASLGHSVTGLDQNRIMLEKANKRAELEQVEVNWREGSVLNLPFEEGSFDVVFAESVTLFTHPEQAMAEYARVLVPGGKLLDRELFARRKHARLEQAMAGLYGIPSLPLLETWMNRLKTAGFIRLQAWSADEGAGSLFGPEANHLWPDPHQIIDFERLMQPEVSRFVEDNRKLITDFGSELGYAVLIGTKPA